MKYKCLPRFRINMNKLISRAEALEDVMVAESSINDMAYLYETNQLVIASGQGGSILLGYKDAEVLMEELPGILDNMRAFRAQKADYGEDCYEL